MNPAPTRKDILSVFAGLRPLAATKEGAKTKEVSQKPQSNHFRIWIGKYYWWKMDNLP